MFIAFDTKLRRQQLQGGIAEKKIIVYMYQITGICDLMTKIRKQNGFGCLAKTESC